MVHEPVLWLPVSVDQPIRGNISGYRRPYQSKNGARQQRSNDGMASTHGMPPFAIEPWRLLDSKNAWKRFQTSPYATLTAAHLLLAHNYS
jgi:hypothetical protein